MKVCAFKDFALLLLCLAMAPRAVRCEPTMASGRLVVRCRVCTITDVALPCEAWFRAPVKLFGLQVMPDSWGARDAIHLSDSTGTAIFERLPAGRYVVSALWIGKRVRVHLPGKGGAVIHGSGEAEQGWQHVPGDTIAIRGGETDSTVIRLTWWWPYKPLYR